MSLSWVNCTHHSRALGISSSMDKQGEFPMIPPVLDLVEFLKEAIPRTMVFPYESYKFNTTSEIKIGRLGVIYMEVFRVDRQMALFLESTIRRQATNISRLLGNPVLPRVLNLLNKIPIMPYM